MKYSDLMCQYLKDAGYTHCFTVTGGNIMHLIGSASNYFKIIPVANEVAAGVAAEYFNESQVGKKAFAMVTAGPGLTNIVTAVAGAFLESRELLVIGGQVKVSDLANGELRQRGIQEIDGVSILKPITKISKLIPKPIPRKEFLEYVLASGKPKKGPVFLEIPLDVQAKNIDEKEVEFFDKTPITHDKLRFDKVLNEKEINSIIDLIKLSKRPVILLGGGVERETTNKLYGFFDKISIPVMTTWNAADRVACDHKNFFGRPNSWGQRYSNILIQQSDLLIAIGTRLGIQQTGFNWEEFLLRGKIIQVDCDSAELVKGHPKVDLPLNCDANDFFEKIITQDLGNHQEWRDFCAMVKNEIPLNEKENNVTAPGHISPYSFVGEISQMLAKDDIVIPCSSGGAFTVMMQCLLNKHGQTIITNKGLASMGYGLSGAIGAGIAFPDKKTILVEGDGGFAQNSQEIATAVYNNVNLKIFIFENSGYASIRMTQKNYFGGKYVGCDVNTGLGFPDWEKLFLSYGVDSVSVDKEGFTKDKKFLDLFNNDRCAAFIVKIDPEQSYFPKISSRVNPDGSMKSNPIHLMTPELSEEIAKKVFKFL